MQVIEPEMCPWIQSKWNSTWCWSCGPQVHTSEQHGHYVSEGTKKNW